MSAQRDFITRAYRSRFRPLRREVPDARYQVPVVVAGSWVLVGTGSVKLKREDDSAHLMAEVSWRLIVLLNDLQDDVIRTIGSPWPVSADQRFGDAFAKAEGSAVIAGYGTEEEPALALAPITLEELLRYQES